jgi:hypothetical protein
MSSFYDQLQNVKDEDVAVASPSEYVDSGFGLIPEGTYDFVIKDFAPAFGDDGSFRKRIDIKKIEIVGVTDEELRKVLGKAVNNLSVFTATYLRNGVKVSGLGDLIRGIDPAREWSSIKDAVDIIQEAVDKNVPIQGKLVWGAFDKSGYETAGGKQMVDKSQEQKDLRKRASVRGMRNFRQLPDNTFLPEVPGPISGEMLEGRVELDRVIAANKKRRMLTA